MKQAMRPLRVMFLGLRGFPDVQGGVETHAEHLCPLLAQLGCDVEVIVRSPYMPLNSGEAWKGVRYRRIWAPKSKALEALVHTFLGVLYAAVRRPDILHIQAIGPALMTPLARLLGLRVVVTHHGPDYARQKWGVFAKWALRSGEAWGMRFAHRRIVISQTIRALIQDKYGLDADLIPNGVTVSALPESSECLSRFGLTRGRYVLMVSRLVPEKRHFDLMEAFDRAGLNGWKLVLVGAADHPDIYTQRVLKAVSTSLQFVSTGFQTGQALGELYAHAGLFVLPSSHEGLPIALLEALSYGLPVLASDIPANLEVGLEEQHYFPLGDIEALAQRLRSIHLVPWSAEKREAVRQWVAVQYDWAEIARKTMRGYTLTLGWTPAHAQPAQQASSR